MNANVHSSNSYPVPKEVGRVGTNSPEFIKPVSQRKGGIEALFAKQAAKGKQAASLASPKKQILATPTSTPSTSKDGTDAIRAIDLEASPPPSESNTKMQSSPARGATPKKRAMVGDPEESPHKKKAKNGDLKAEME